MKRMESHFFKVILQSTLEEKKLKIPEKFVRRLGDELSAVAILMVPNGRVWRVGVTKDKREIWFDDGWDEFVKYHSICIGYFLVFKYAKNSTFDVHIFNSTTCEIYYPQNFVEPKQEEQSSMHGDEMECKNSIKILGSLTSDKNGMHKSEGSLLRKRHLNETAENFRAPKATVQDEHETEVVDGVGHKWLASLEGMGIYISRSYLFLAAEERKRAITAARLFEPKNPSFMVILKADARRRGYLFVPSKFATKYLSTVPKFIKVQVSDGRVWSLQTRSSARCGSLYLSHGWGRFFGEMNLGRGDICIFELIKTTDDVLLMVSVLNSST